jgi:hypothetical protein
MDLIASCPVYVVVSPAWRGIGAARRLPRDIATVRRRLTNDVSLVEALREVERVQEGTRVAGACNDTHACRNRGGKRANDNNVKDTKVRWMTGVSVAQHIFSLSGWITS